MPELTYHGGFILAAYAVTILILAGVFLWIILDGRAQKKRLAELEARGIRRRSVAAPSKPAGDPSPASSP
jgi:heme exporter protein D